METYSLEVPAMYADHHVVEVRRILLELPGVAQVYASSAFRRVEVTCDPAQVSSEAIAAKLEAAGYLGELPLPVETGAVPATQAERPAFFRTTASYENTRQVVSFAQKITASGRPLWPCPGMGALAPQAPKTGED